MLVERLDNSGHLEDKDGYGRAIAGWSSGHIKQLHVSMFVALNPGLWYKTVLCIWLGWLIVLISSRGAGIFLFVITVSEVVQPFPVSRMHLLLLPCPTYPLLHGMMYRHKST